MTTTIESAADLSEISRLRRLVASVASEAANAEVSSDDATATVQRLVMDLEAAIADLSRFGK